MRGILELTLVKGDLGFLKYLVSNYSVDVNGELLPRITCNVTLLCVWVCVWAGVCTCLRACMRQCMHECLCTYHIIAQENDYLFRHVNRSTNPTVVL